MTTNTDMICLTRYPGWQEMRMIMHLYVTIHIIHNIIALKCVLQIVSDNVYNTNITFNRGS